MKVHAQRQAESVLWRRTNVTGIQLRLWTGAGIKAMKLEESLRTHPSTGS